MDLRHDLRPVITYGAVAWFAKASQLSTRKRLDKVFACVCITGAMRTCPTRALEVIADLTPLHPVFDSVAHEAILRISKEGVGNERINNQRVQSSLNNYISSANLPNDVMIKKVSSENNFRTLLSKREEWEREYTVYNLEENTVKWYTDGSKTSLGAGAGIQGPITKCELSLGSCVSVFEAQILAIERSLEINLKRNYPKN